MMDNPTHERSQNAEEDYRPEVSLEMLKRHPSITILEDLDSPSNSSQISDDERTQKPPLRRSSTFSKFNLSEQTCWAFEMLALLLSLVTFTALIAVLKYYDRRPQKEWQYNHLTLNGLVALLSTICRAALLIPVTAALSQGKWIWYSRGTAGKPLADLEVFDDASRGALGSIRLLWRIKGRHFISFGALLIILALAFDTTSQQVLSVDFRNVIDTRPSAAASVPRSEMYDRVLDDPNSSLGIPIADLPMQAAIYTGILTENLTDLPVYCSSGNCTWPIVPTLGMCGDCADVGNHLTHKCNSTHCTYSLPSGNSITGPMAGSNSTDQGVLFAVLTTTGTVFKASGTGIGSPLYVLQYEAIGLPGQAVQSLNPNDSRVTANECALWFCVQAYDLSVTDGLQSQKTIGTWGKVGKDLTFVDIPPEFNVAPDTSFGVSARAYHGLAIVLTNLVNMGPSVCRVGNQNRYSHDALQALWQRAQGSHNWIPFITNFALSISNSIRLTAPAANTTTEESQYYAGTPYTPSSFVRVRWAWLAFPACMVVASVFFLILSMWETRRSKVSGWKANPLQLLFTHVDGDLVRKAEGVTRLEDLKKSVGSEKVRLERDAVGLWHFRRP